MQVNIGIRDTSREISLDVDATGEDIYALVAAFHESHQPLKLVDKEGKLAIVPFESLAYVEVAAAENRRVGFGL